MDGYASAFIFKKYFVPLLNLPDNIPILGVQHEDIELERFECQEGDIILDLPKPKKDIFFWCDHHGSNKPDSPLPENHYFKEVPSCTGLLIDILKEKGITLPQEIEEFKKAIDTMDGALYTPEQIEKVYYPLKDKSNLTTLQKVHVISAMFHTKDRILNKHIIKHLLKGELPASPVDGKIWELNPGMFFDAQVEAHEKWRRWAKDKFEFDQSSNTAILDNRAGRSKGSKDRFYIYLVFPQASYSLSISLRDDVAYIGLGCNIFQKERCLVDIGKICEQVGHKFGEGSGGGHKQVGGASIKADNCNAARAFILEQLRQT